MIHRPTMAKVKTLRDNTQRDRARQLRHEQTRAEAQLWHSRRARRLGGRQWRRQVPRGPYIVDFICIEAGLVVELDGGQHADQVAYDGRRTTYLGLRVMRFWNHAITEDCNAVCLQILAACGGDRGTVEGVG